MLKELKFVQGAIKKNGLSPELEHFRIKDGRVTGFNGYMALSSPIPLDIDAMPHARQFHKAIEACSDKIAIRMTEAGRLYIRSGAFSAYIPCLEKEVYDAVPGGDEFEAPKDLVKTFRRMLPFIGEDASRPWAMGLAVGGGSYTATNNVILLQVWDGHNLPEINLPRFAVAEVVRAKQQPEKIMVEAGAVSFIYPDGSWLRTQILADEWPTEKMNSIFDRRCDPKPVPEGLDKALEEIAPFVENEKISPIFFEEDRITTTQQTDEAQEGAAYTVSGIPGGPAYRLHALRLLAPEWKTADFDIDPCLFFGDNSRGALIGMRF